MRTFVTILIILGALALWDIGWWFGFGVSPLSPYAMKMAIVERRAPTIVDVRTPTEFKYFHIPGAINVPYPPTLAQLAFVLPDPTKPVVVVCMTGHRSQPVVHQLQQGGYTNVHNLTWGMLAWKIFGGETESSQ